MICSKCGLQMVEDGVLYSSPLLKEYVCGCGNREHSQYTPSDNSGVKVIVDDNACTRKEFVQYKFPKSKKARIRKKWRKNSNNYRYEEKYFCFRNGNVALVPSHVYNELMMSSYLNNVD